MQDFSGKVKKNLEGVKNCINFAVAKATKTRHSKERWVSG